MGHWSLFIKSKIKSPTSSLILVRRFSYHLKALITFKGMCPRDKLYVLGYFPLLPCHYEKEIKYELSFKLKFEVIPLYMLENIYEDTLKSLLLNQGNVY